MQGRHKLLVVLASLSLLAGLGAVATGRPGAARDQHEPGKSGATITGDFDDKCTDFHADSSKDISYVQILYSDGSSEKIEGQALAEMDTDGDATTFDLEGDKAISMVEVKSGTTRKTFKCPQCQDQKDNDGDGKADFPADPGCESEDDDDESDGGGPKPQCSDGIDNDGGGKTDFPADPGCDSPEDDDETSQCQDGADNDGDGKKDFPKDPGCDSLEDDDESDGGGPKPQCSDGIDNDGGGKTDFPEDPGCDSPEDDDETSQCQDGADNDGDEKKDFPEDPGCDSLEDDDESDGAPAGNFTCRASALRVEESLLNDLLGNPFEPLVANAAQNPCAAENASLLDETVAGAPGSLTVEVLSAETEGSDESGSADATVAEVVIRDATGAVILSATALDAHADAACENGNATTDGTSRVASVTLPDGTTITPDDGEHIHVELPGGAGTLHVNHVETTTTQDGEQTTVRSLWLDTATPLGDVIVAEAVADVHGDPC